MASSKYKKIKEYSSVANCLNYVEDKKDAIKNFEDKSKEEKEPINRDDIDLLNYATDKNKCLDKEAPEFDENGKQIPIKERLLISQLNCRSIDTMGEDFIEADIKYHEKGNERLSKKYLPNKAFHIIQSFKGKEASGKVSHGIGIELAKRLCGEDFRVAITTHLNTENTHNHIVVSAFSIKGHYKFRDEWNFAKKLQQINDDLALENGLSIISEFSDNYEKEDYKKDKHKKKHLTKTPKDEVNRKAIKDDIDEVVNKTNNFKDFKKALKEKDCNIKLNIYKGKVKSITFKSSKYGTIRGERLGYDYRYQTIRNRLNRAIYSEIEAFKITIKDIRALRPKKYLDPTSITDRQRNPIIFQLIDFLINLINLILKGNENNKEFKPELKKALINKKDKLEIVKKIIEKRGIKSNTDFYIKKNEILKKYKINQNLLNVFTSGIHQRTLIKNAIETINKLKPVMDEYKLTDEALKLIKASGEANELENKVKLNPVEPFIKARLFDAIKKNDYTLIYSIKQLTQKEANSILKYLKGEIAEKPKSIIKIEDYNKLSEKEKEALKPIKKQNLYKGEEAFNFKKYVADNNLDPVHNEEHKKIIDNIKAYINAKNTLTINGLNTEDEINDFIKKNDERINKVKELRNTLKGLKDELDDFNVIEAQIQEEAKEIILNLIENRSEVEEVLNHIINDNYDKYTIMEVLNDIKEKYKDDFKKLFGEKYYASILPPYTITILAEAINHLKAMKNEEKTDYKNLSRESLKDFIINYIKDNDFIKQQQEIVKMELAEEPKEIKIDTTLKIDNDNLENAKIASGASIKEKNKVDEEKLKEEFGKTLQKENEKNY